MASRFLGWGDYAIGVNSLINPDTGVPNLAKGVDASNVRIRHSEFLGDISVAVGSTFATQFSQTINPGNRLVFPWLSTIAQGYEQWTPKGIVFEFKSTASTNVSSGTNLGNVAIASDYDVYDDVPGSRVQMLQMAFSQDGSVGANQYHGLECDPRQNPFGKYWILHEDEVIEGSAREYHLCHTTVSAINGSAAGVVGQLWIHYDIELSKERMPPSLLFLEQFGNSNFDRTSPFGTGLQVVKKHDVSDSSLSGTTYTFPSYVREGMCFLIHIRWKWSVAPTTFSYDTITFTNCEPWSNLAADGLFLEDSLTTTFWATGPTTNGTSLGTATRCGETYGVRITNTASINQRATFANLLGGSGGTASWVAVTITRVR